MTAPNQKSPRVVAADTLNQFDPIHSYASPILNKLLRQTQQKQQATDLVYGTIRNTNTLDSLVAELADCPVSRIPSKIRNIIRIAAYELVYCPQTPAYAIVNEAVKNTKIIAGKKQTAFVNAVLRKITRHIKNRRISSPDAHLSNILPTSISTACEFDTDILPNFKTQPDEYLAKAFSLPQWLIKDWIENFSLETALQICFASNRKPSIYLRPNKTKIKTTQLEENFKKTGIDFEVPQNPTLLLVRSQKEILNLPGFTQGLFTVQDYAASQPVAVLAPKTDWKILDLCAAPGTKTTQLAEFTNDKAAIFATDIDKKRLQMVKENADRLELKSITVFAYDKLSEIARDFAPFNAVLLDVPCSNTAVLAKRPEVRYRITKKALKKLTAVQYELLEKAASLIKPNGKICYSTCSIQPDENGTVVSKFLAKNKNFKLEKEKLTLPSAQAPDHDGSYVAVIKAE